MNPVWNIVLGSKRSPSGWIIVSRKTAIIIVCIIIGNKVIGAIDVLSKPDHPRQAVNNLRNGDVDFSFCKLANRSF